MIPDTRQRLEEAVRELRGLVVRGRGGGEAVGRRWLARTPTRPLVTQPRCPGRRSMARLWWAARSWRRRRKSSQPRWSEGAAWAGGGREGERSGAAR